MEEKTPKYKNKLILWFTISSLVTSGLAYFFREFLHIEGGFEWILNTVKTILWIII